MNEAERNEYRSELTQYVIGLAGAVITTAIAFILVATRAMSRLDVLIAIAVLAVIQIVVHFRCFLHIDLSKSKRDDLQLILFSTLIVILMVSGTIWIISNQHARMM